MLHMALVEGSLSKEHIGEFQAGQGGETRCPRGSQRKSGAEGQEGTCEEGRARVAGDANGASEGCRRTSLRGLPRATACSYCSAAASTHTWRGRSKSDRLNQHGTHLKKKG